MAAKKPAKKTSAKAGEQFNRPLKFLQNLDEYKRVAESQREHAREIASLIRKGKKLDRIQADFASAILLGWANNLSDKPKGKQGPPPKFDPASEALVYVAYVYGKGCKPSVAVASIADRVGASETAVRKGIKPYLGSASEFMGIFLPKNQ